jgi:hypothetical protein
MVPHFVQRLECRSPTSPVNTVDLAELTRHKRESFLNEKFPCLLSYEKVIFNIQRITAQGKNYLHFLLKNKEAFSICQSLPKA